MNRGNGTSGPQGGRVQWGSYGFLAGIALGILIGWMFGGLVGAFMRVALVLLVIVPLVVIFLAWRKYVAPLLQPHSQPPARAEYAYFEPMEAIETRGVIRGSVREPNLR